MNTLVLYIRRSRRYFYKNIIDDKPDILGEKHISDLKKSDELWRKIFGKSIAETKSDISKIVFNHNILFKPDIIYNYSLPKCLPIGSFIYPIDEDDLIDNKMLSKIRQYNGDNDYLVWNTNILTCNKISQSEKAGLQSNSYAVRYTGANITNTLHKHIYFHDNYIDTAHDIGITSGLKITSPVSVGSFKQYNSIDDIKDVTNKFTTLNNDIVPKIYRDAFRKIKECFKYDKRR